MSSTMFDTPERRALLKAYLPRLEGVARKRVSAFLGAGDVGTAGKRSGCSYSTMYGALARVWSRMYFEGYRDRNDQLTTKGKELVAMTESSEVGMLDVHRAYATTLRRIAKRLKRARRAGLEVFVSGLRVCDIRCEPPNIHFEFEIGDSEKWPGLSMVDWDPDFLLAIARDAIIVRRPGSRPAWDPFEEGR